MLSARLRSQYIKPSEKDFKGRHYSKSDDYLSCYLVFTLCLKLSRLRRNSIICTEPLITMALQLVLYFYPKEIVKVAKRFFNTSLDGDGLFSANEMGTDCALALSKGCSECTKRIHYSQ